MNKNLLEETQSLFDLLYETIKITKKTVHSTSLYYKNKYSRHFTSKEVLFIGKIYINLKKNGACVFWAPVVFLSLLAGKFNHFQTDVIEMQSSK